MNIPTLTAVDCVAAILLGLGILRGFFRGFAGEVARLFGWLAAIAVGLRGRSAVTEWMAAHTRLEGRAADLMAFVAPVAAVLLAAFVARAVVRALMRVAVEVRFNRLMGALVGGMRAAVFVAAVVLVMNLAPVPALNRAFGERSVVGALVRRAADTVAPGFLPPEPPRDPAVEPAEAPP